MTFPVQIEFGNHRIAAHLHALPRAGDLISCAFPSSGIPMLFLSVVRVHFHQMSKFTGRECKDPLAIVVTTKSDPAHRVKNKETFAALVEGKAAARGRKFGGRKKTERRTP